MPLKLNEAPNIALCEINKVEKNSGYGVLFSYLTCGYSPYFIGKKKPESSCYYPKDLPLESNMELPELKSDLEDKIKLVTENITMKQKKLVQNPQTRDEVIVWQVEQTKILLSVALQQNNLVNYHKAFQKAFDKIKMKTPEIISNTEIMPLHLRMKK